MKRVIALSLSAALVLAMGCASSGTAPGTSRSAGSIAGEEVGGQGHPLKQWLTTGSRAKKKGLKGALIGALAGAGAAFIRGDNPLAGAAVGAAVGGLVGFAIGKRQDKLFAGRDLAVETLSYDPSQGYVIQVESVRFEPATVEPGDEAELYVRYIVVGPNPKEDITVSSYMGVKYDEEYVMGDGPSEFVVPNGGGVVDVRIPLTVPKDAPTGTYAVQALMDDPGGRFQVEGSTPMYVAAG